MSAKAAIEERLRVIGSPRNKLSNNNESLIKQWDDSLKTFSHDIKQYYYDNRQTREEFNKKLKILKEIEQYLESNIFNKRIGGIQYEVKAVVPFGSSASGLGMEGGDLDMTICVYPAISRKRTEEIHTRSNEILAEIFKKIQSGQMLKGRELEDMEHIDGARVPIVTGIVDEVELDISISMTPLVSAQYLASKFIDAYEQYDRRFILLAAFVKEWQKSKKTDENEDYYKTVFPNSCSTVLMVIFFMKYYKLLPNINKRHQDKLSDARATWPRVNQGEHGSFGIPKKEVNNWKNSNNCDISLGTLFLLYLDFYANVVNLKEYRLVIENGTFKSKGKSNAKHRIMIEDVLDKENAAKSVTEAGMFRKLLNEAKAIVMKTDPEDIEEELMEDTLTDISSYSRQEILQLRHQGLYAAIPGFRG